MATISVDPGHGYTKIVGLGKELLFESVLGEVQSGLRSENGIARIGTADGDWLIGRSARLFSHSQITGNDDRWALSPEYRALLLYGISELTSLETGSVIVDLVVGLPINDYKRNRGELSASLIANHWVSRPGRRKLAVIIRNVIVVPQGALPAKPYQKDGSIVGTLDVGTRNTNWIRFVGSTLSGHGSTEFGAAGTLATISSRIEDSTRRQYSNLEIVEILAGTRQCKAFGKPFDASEIIDYHTEVYAKSLVSSIAKAQGNTADLDHLLIFGGGALLVGDYLKEIYPQATILDNPQWAAVYAQLDYAKRKFR